MVRRSDCPGTHSHLQFALKWRSAIWRWGLAAGWRENSLICESPPQDQRPRMRPMPPQSASFAPARGGSEFWGIGIVQRADLMKSAQGFHAVKSRDGAFAQPLCGLLSTSAIFWDSRAPTMQGNCRRGAARSVVRATSGPSKSATTNAVPPPAGGNISLWGA